jgi:hypothetical protein
MFLRDTFEELTNLYLATRKGASTADKELTSRGVEFRKWAQLALDEKRKVDELYGKIAPGGRGVVIDFAEARAHIGRRFARLRTAVTAGGVP